MVPRGQRPKCDLKGYVEFFLLFFFSFQPGFQKNSRLLSVFAHVGLCIQMSLCVCICHLYLIFFVLSGPILAQFWGS